MSKKVMLEERLLFVYQVIAWVVVGICLLLESFSSSEGFLKVVALLFVAMLIKLVKDKSEVMFFNVALFGAFLAIFNVGVCLILLKAFLVVLLFDVMFLLKTEYLPLRLFALFALLFVLVSFVSFNGIDVTFLSIILSVEIVIGGVVGVIMIIDEYRQVEQDAL